MLHPQISAAPDASGGVKQAPCTVCTEEQFVAGYSQEFEKAAHWSSLICISLSSSALLGWKGSRNAEEVLSWGITHLQPPSPPSVGQESWEQRELVSHSCGSAAPLQASITSQEPHPNNVFLLVLVPSFGSLHAGVSVVPHSSWCPFQT